MLSILVIDAAEPNLFFTQLGFFIQREGAIIDDRVALTRYKFRGDRLHNILFKANPAERMTAFEALSHPWMRYSSFQWLQDIHNGKTNAPQ
jgi:hypothetical protein